MKHIRIESPTPGHRVMLDNVEGKFETYCVCGWASYVEKNERAVIRRGAEHLERVSDDIKYRVVTEQHELALARGESLARALAHIDRCQTCGSWQWDGDCSTCVPLHHKQARQHLKEAA